MGPVSAVRSQVQTLGTSPQPAAGTNQGGSAALNGGRAERAAEPVTQQAVAPANGAARGDAPAQRRVPEPVPEPSFVVQSAKARAEAAQRAYMMASIAAGLNPLNDPVP